MGLHIANKQGLRCINERKIVAFGVSPTRAEKGYGYLETGSALGNSSGTFELSRFKEKPSSEQAEKMLKTGKYLWNSRVFMFRLRDLLEAFLEHAPKLLALTSMLVKTTESDQRFVRLGSEFWDMLDNISIDHAIMEKIDNLAVVPINLGWSDIGDWGAIWSQNDRNKEGVSLTESSIAIDCKNLLIWPENNDQAIVGLGLENIVAVTTSDAVIVAHKRRAQDVKEVVDFLDSLLIFQAISSPKDCRPLGWFERLAIGKKVFYCEICSSCGDNFPPRRSFR